MAEFFRANPARVLDAAPVAVAEASTPPATPPHWRLLATLSALMGFASISTDLYLPALPTMGQALGASAGTMEWTIAGYLIGFSLGQLFWGPIGDRFGRRIPVAIGMALFVVGSAGCALSDTAWQLIGWRVVQALGACAGVVLARAMVRDLYPRDRAAQTLSTLIVIMAIAPLIGPLVGGQILAVGSWRLIFWLLVGVGLLTLVAVITLPETLSVERRTNSSLGRTITGYADLLRNRRLLGYCATGGLFYVGVYAYIAGSPFAYIDFYGVSAQAYGLLFGSAILGIMALNVVNSRLITQYGSDKLLHVGALGAAISGAAAAATSLTGFGGLVGLASALFAFAAMSGLIVANSIAGALEEFPERAGAASALVGASHYGTGIIGAGLVGIFADGTPLPLGAVVAIGGLGSFLLVRWLVPLR